MSCVLLHVVNSVKSFQHMVLVASVAALVLVLLSVLLLPREDIDKVMQLVSLFSPYSRFLALEHGVRVCRASPPASSACSFPDLFPFYVSNKRTSEPGIVGNRQVSDLGIVINCLITWSAGSGALRLATTGVTCWRWSKQMGL
jgi:hypothetical protein